MRHLLVTHHAPDLDACGAVWLFKRFDAQHYADAGVAFVDPGSVISASEAERLGFQMHYVTHVDTGLGEFDHHQPERGLQQICASSLVYDHICKIHPELQKDPALKYLVEFINQIDHFGEISWPDAGSPRYCLMIHELIAAYEAVDPHNDESQLHFGLQCLDSGYMAIKETMQAQETIKEGREFMLNIGKCLAIESKNDWIVKVAQRSGFALVIRKDPALGDIRIKARPDVQIDLKALADKIATVDQVGSWYYHPSGKMLLNGSKKHRHQKPSPLTLDQVVDLAQELYG